jgi:hypothetical protein
MGLRLQIYLQISDFPLWSTVTPNSMQQYQPAEESEVGLFLCVTLKILSRFCEFSLASCRVTQLKRTAVLRHSPVTAIDV